MGLTAAQQSWVNSLRIAQCPQCNGALRIGNKRDAFGIAIECYVALVDSDYPRYAADDEHGNTDVWYFGKKQETNHCPPEVAAWLGLADAIGSFEWGPIQNVLLGEHDASIGEVSIAGCNDVGMTFDEIADLIESNPAGLFNE